MKKKSKLLNTDSKLLRIVAFLVCLFLFYIIWLNREYYSSLTNYGYLGLFLFNFISNATVIFPIPSIASVFIGGALWNPLMVAISTGAGAALGELFGYYVGYGGRGFISSPKNRKHWIFQIKNLFQKHGFITIFIFALLPLPFDIVGIMAGSLNYSVWKFLSATLSGRILRNSIIALTSARFLTL